MTPEAFRALVARVWARQAPSSRWLVVSPPLRIMPERSGVAVKKVPMRIHR